MRRDNPRDIFYEASQALLYARVALLDGSAEDHVYVRLYSDPTEQAASAAFELCAALAQGEMSQAIFR